MKSREAFREWSDAYILGFFEGLTARHSYAHPRILGLLDSMKKGNRDAGLSKDYMTFHTNEELAAILRVLSRWWMRVICIDDVLSLFTEHEQAMAWRQRGMTLKSRCLI